MMNTRFLAIEYGNHAVYTTVATHEQATQLAHEAVELGLAACVQFEAIQSTYRWQGEIVQEPEYRLMFKTTRSEYQALEAWLHQQHPYELPAIYAIPISEASADYAHWVAQMVVKK